MACHTATARNDGENSNAVNSVNTADTIDAIVTYVMGPDMNMPSVKLDLESGTLTIYPRVRVPATLVPNGMLRQMAVDIADDLGADVTLHKDGSMSVCCFNALYDTLVTHERSSKMVRTMIGTISYHRSRITGTRSLVVDGPCLGRAEAIQKALWPHWKADPQ